MGLVDKRAHGLERAQEPAISQVTGSTLVEEVAARSIAEELSRDSTVAEVEAAGDIEVKRRHLGDSFRAGLH